MEMKEMVYDGSGRSELLYTEMDDAGYGIAVLNIRGAYPCGYITFPGTEKFSDTWIDMWISDPHVNIHGGFTYIGELAVDLPGIWLGWDYAHWDDHIAYPPGYFQDIHKGRKWTTEEIVDAARKAVQAIREGKYVIDQNEDEEEESADEGIE